MAWRIVKQPNGLLARFSDIVDNFTHTNMTVEEATEICEFHMGKRDAEEKVNRGVNDGSIDGEPNAGDGLHRWRQSIETIRLIHGKAEAAKVEALGITTKQEGMG